MYFKSMMLRLLTLLLCLSPFFSTWAGDVWPEGSRQLLEQAKKDKDYAEVARLKPEFFPTKDGRSFLLAWKRGYPKKWIVSLPGTGGYATRDLVVWEPHLKNRDVGFISVQWWLGHGDSTKDYYTPFEIYREVDLLLKQLQVSPGSVLLEGFSRGSANCYAVAALDHRRGGHYFSLAVASSGGAALDYPPTRLVNTGEFGEKPFEGLKWVTVAGGKDENPERDGIPAMRRTAEWLKSMGGEVVLQIEDTAQGHGAFHRNPANTRQVLDLFLN